MTEGHQNSIAMEQSVSERLWVRASPGIPVCHTAHWESGKPWVLGIILPRKQQRHHLSFTI